MSDLDEEFIPEEDAENPIGAIKKLRERLRAAEAESKTNLEGWQRTKADFVNFKKDEETRRNNDKARSTVSKVEDLIRLLDGFEMGFKAHVNQNPDPGMKALYQLLLQTIKDWGVEQLDTKVGEAFDPHKHEALREVTVDNPEKDHTIVDILSSGYTLGDFIIRPTQVSVGLYQK